MLFLIDGVSEQCGDTMHHQQKLSNNWSNIIIIIIEISTAPYLLKILQPKARTKAIPATISSHRQTNRQTHTHIHTHTHTRTHTLSHTSSFKNYMPPKYTYQKADNQTVGASCALSLSLSLSPYLLTHWCKSHAVLQEEK